MNLDDVPLHLPNLPGIRRGPLEAPPMRYSKTRPRPLHTKSSVDDLPPVLDSPSMLNAYEDIVKSSSNFPSKASAFNDIKGRYSLKAREQDRQNKQLSLPYSNLETVPSFVVNYKGRVSHILAYFTEMVPENLIEPTRSRLVEFIYYVEDDTFEIVEPPVRNSGLPYGKMLKRGQVKNEKTNKMLHLFDFTAGSEVLIYGKTYTVINCDNETKRYMANRGVNFGEALPFPGDKNSNSKNSNKNKFDRINKRLFDGDENKILKFLGVWGDDSVQIHYTVADNTMSIYEIKEHDNGKKPSVSILLKRTRVKKEVLDGNEDDSTILITTADEVGLPSGHKIQYFLHWSDIEIGKIITMSGMPIQIIDADYITRDFYSAHNHPLDDPITIERPIKEVFSPIIPPHTGFGSYADSLTSCTGSLVPHAVKKNLSKMKEFEGVKLQFSATLDDPNMEPNEKPREFVIILFMEDDHIQILEIPEKNSGRIAGTFLSKTILHKPTGELMFPPTSFYAGAIMVINGYKFTLYNASEMTLNYMEKRCDIWDKCDILKIQSKLRKFAPDILESIQNTNYEDVILTPNDLHHYLQPLQLSFELQEYITLIREISGSKTDRSKKAEILLSQFLDYLQQYL